MTERAVNSVTMSQIGHPDLVALYDYWNSKRANRRMPSRTDIDPAELSSRLPHIALIDVVDDPLRFRFRLVGSYTYELRDSHILRELTGRYVDEVPFHIGSNEALMRVGRSVVERRRPVLIDGPRNRKAKKTGRQLILIMPLSTDDHRVDMMFCGIYRTFGDDNLSTELRITEFPPDDT
ncbi:MAG: PAS domain-containing protein [Alphaproteobacteria bacterium]|nr:PAS domain-containing protein [Alphaproteobacteria bacterium]